MLNVKVSIDYPFNLPNHSTRLVESTLLAFNIIFFFLRFKECRSHNFYFLLFINIFNNINKMKCTSNFGWCQLHNDVKMGLTFLNYHKMMWNDFLVGWSQWLARMWHLNVLFIFSSVHHLLIRDKQTCNTKFECDK